MVVWDATPLESELLVQVDRLVGQGSEVPVMVASRLLVPESSNPVRDQGQTESTVCRCSHTDRRRTPQRIKEKGQQHLSGEEARLIGEHRNSGEKKYYLANLLAETDLRRVAAILKGLDL
jgi:hypothetical protein